MKIVTLQLMYKAHGAAVLHGAGKLLLRQKDFIFTAVKRDPMALAFADASIVGASSCLATRVFLFCCVGAAHNLRRTLHQTIHVC